MRSTGVVTLFITGALIIALPPLADAWRTAMLTHALEHGANLAPWDGLMDGPYRFGCWLLGAVMICVGIKILIGQPSDTPDLAPSASVG